MKPIALLLLLAPLGLTAEEVTNTIPQQTQEEQQREAALSDAAAQLSTAENRPGKADAALALAEQYVATSGSPGAAKVANMIQRARMAREAGQTRRADRLVNRAQAWVSREHRDAAYRARFEAIRNEVIARCGSSR